MKILVFDTETTCLPPKDTVFNLKNQPYIIQLSYIIYDLKDNTLQVENDYINIPDSVRISRDSYKIHKITKRMCREGIKIKEALQKFSDHLSECSMIVGHNINFDKKMLINEGKRNNHLVFVKDINEFCTMKNSVELLNIKKINEKGEEYLKYPTLSELHKHLFKYQPKNTHDALVDVLICFKCFAKLRYNFDITNVNRNLRYLLRQK